jgi:hypothetical protein
METNMPNELELLLRGPGAEAAADDLEALLADEAAGPEAGPALTRRPAAPTDSGLTKAVDPIAVTALILAIPSAVLAVWDLGSRLEARRKAGRIIEQAQRLRIERGTETFVLTLEGPRALETLDPDRLLELAAGADPAPPTDGETGEA